MGQFIFNNFNQLIAIAANDNDKNSLNVNLDDCIITTPTDDDFNKIRFGGYWLEKDGDNITYHDPIVSYTDQESLNVWISEVKNKCQQMLNNNNGNAMESQVQTYLKTLNSFDTSTITYPLESTWEKYCVDNSITFLHPLQIP
jgi:hypothetical protein